MNCRQHIQSDDLRFIIHEVDVHKDLTIIL